MEFSSRQREALRHACDPRTFLVACGSVRSGKTWSVGLSFAAWLTRQTEPFHHLLLAVSVEVAMRNIGFDLIEHVAGLGGHADVNKVYGTRIIVKYPERPPQSVWVVGAADERARKRLQGATMKGAVLEEFPLLPLPAFEFAWSRLSVEGAKAWATANPEGPAHWAKRQVIDRIESFNGYELAFRLRDNPTLDDATIDRLESSFTGFQRKRLIEGQWAAASGACWPEWTTADGPHPKDYDHLTLGLDWATSGTLFVVAMRHPRPMDRAWISNELRHVGAEDGLLTAPAFAEKVAAWCLGELGTRPDGVPVVHDPSMPEEAERALRYHGFRLVQGRNDVAPGIMAVNARLADGRLKVHERCRNLADEMASYVWDERAALLGEDVPVKAADHGCDALRYVVFTRWTNIPPGGRPKAHGVSLRLRGF